MRYRLLGGALMCLFIFLSVISTPSRAQAAHLYTEIQTVPALPGVKMTLDGQTFLTNHQGIAQVPLGGIKHSDRIKVSAKRLGPEVVARFERWFPNRSSRLVAAMGTYFRITMAYEGFEGEPVSPSTVSETDLKSNIGGTYEFRGAGPVWLQGARVARLGGRFTSKDVHYAVEAVVVHGTSVVNRSQQVFFPASTRHWRIQLLYYPAHFMVRDALFRFPVGSSIRIRYPDGHIKQHSLDAGATWSARALPRGSYEVSAKGLGLSVAAPVAVSRAQQVEVLILSYLDIAVAVLFMACFVIGLLLLGRPRLRARVRAGFLRSLRARRHPYAA
jgi:hypothetical protein